jgi:hypothetical protein
LRRAHKKQKAMLIAVSGVPNNAAKGECIAMKHKSIAVLILSIFSGAVGGAQNVTGSGTPGTVPLFTDTSTIANSGIVQSPDGNIGIGFTSPPSTLSVNNNQTSSNSGFQPYAIYGVLSSSTLNFSSAIRGDSLAPTGGGNGVIGLTSSSGGAGLLGVTVEPTGGGYGVIGGGGTNGEGAGGGGGVLGLTQAVTGFTSAVRGIANGTSGGSVAVFAEQFSPDATAGLFTNRAGGSVLIGTVGSPDRTIFRVDGEGRVFADGGFRPFGADFAESMTVKGDPEHYRPGDLLAVDTTGNRRLALARGAYSTLVAGIYSTQPGVLGSTKRVGEAGDGSEVPLAVMGIVPCNVSTENGPISAGDLLVTSSAPGYAMKGTDRRRMLGAVIGKALEPLQSGKGVIQVLVTLQ